MVNAIDFNMVKQSFGADSPNSDFNNDGVVNAQDFNLMKTNFGAAGDNLTCP